MHPSRPAHTEDVIEAMVASLCAPSDSARNRQICREALRALVRLGQAEQLMSMQIDFQCLTRGPTLRH